MCVCVSLSLSLSLSIYIYIYIYIYMFFIFYGHSLQSPFLLLWTSEEVILAMDVYNKVDQDCLHVNSHVYCNTENSVPSDLNTVVMHLKLMLAD